MLTSSLRCFISFASILLAFSQDIAFVNQGIEINSIDFNYGKDFVKQKENLLDVKSTSAFESTSRRRSFSQTDSAIIQSTYKTVVCCMFYANGVLMDSDKEFFGNSCSDDAILEILESIEEFAHHIDVGEHLTQPYINLQHFSCASPETEISKLSKDIFVSRQVSLVEVLIWQYGFITRMSNYEIRSSVAKIAGACVQNNPFSRTFLLQSDAFGNIMVNQKAVNEERKPLSDIILWLICFGEHNAFVKAKWIFVLNGLLDEIPLLETIKISLLGPISNYDLAIIGRVFQSNDSFVNYPEKAVFFSKIMDIALSSNSLVLFKKSCSLITTMVSLSKIESDSSSIRRSSLKWIVDDKFILKLQKFISALCGTDVLSYSSICLTFLDSYIIILENIENQFFSTEESDSFVYFMASLMKSLKRFDLKTSRNLYSFVERKPFLMQCSASENDWLYENAREAAEEWYVRLLETIDKIHK